MRIRAMIAEDERLAREELAYLLQLEEDVAVCPSAETGEQLLQLQKQYRPDVVFLDIQMPGLSGVEAAKQLPKECDREALVPLIVFTTAFDDYAVDAFELEAVDYLLKPYDEKRFKVAMERVRRRLAHRVTGGSARAASSPFGINSGPHTGEMTGSGLAVAEETSAPVVRTTKLLINDGEKSVLVAPGDICYAVRVQRTLEVHTEDQVLQSKMTLRELQGKLQDFPFFRSHRAYLVNLDYVQEITPWFNGAYNLTLRDGKKSQIPVSRAAAKRLFRLIGNEH